MEIKGLWIDVVVGVRMQMLCRDSEESVYDCMQGWTL